MAILIPHDALNNPGIPVVERQVAQSLVQSLGEGSWVYYNPRSCSTRPRYLIISPEYGVVCLDVRSWHPMEVERADRTGLHITGAGHQVPLENLSRKVETLRHLMPPRARQHVAALVVLPCFLTTDVDRVGLRAYFPPGSVVARDELAATAWLEALSGSGLGTDDVEMVRAALYPESVFMRPRPRVVGSKLERSEIRVQLDAEQESLARSLTDGVTLLLGVSGSGKTIVLAARARVLAETNPDWEILLLCFNRTLVDYLQGLVGHHSRIKVATFHGWAQAHGVRIPWADEDQRRTKAVVDRVLSSGTVRARYDAILVDEAQDFGADWLRLVHSTLRRGRGGMVLAADPGQEIYRSELRSAALPIDQLVSLTRNYRNTEEVGRFAHGAVFGPPGQVATVSTGVPPVADFALQGDPVHLVWAERWDKQADFIAKEVLQLVESGVASYAEIAVLYTQRTGMAARLASALDTAKIPFHWVNRDKQSKAALDLRQDTVKLMTVHSAKGLEFRFVFLFGVEAIKTGCTFASSTPEEANRARAVYVGMTRAQERLYVTYTRPNPIVARARELRKWCECLIYPDDFRFV